MLTEQDKGLKVVRKQGQAVSEKEGETKNSPNLTPNRKRKGVTETQPTFCGDLDVGTGDCDLMFLAEEPADRSEGGRERETVGERERIKQGKFKLEECFLAFTRMTQHESCKHTHMEPRGPVA